MDSELGGWLWFALDVIATAILALSILVAYRSYQERFGESGSRIDDAQPQRVRRR